MSDRKTFAAHMGALFAQFQIAARERVRGEKMAAILVGNWWVLALRGALAILFALVAFFMAGVTATVLVLVFGAYAFVDGIFALIAGLRAARHHGRSAPLLLEGVLNLLIGVIWCSSGRWRRWSRWST